MNIYVEDIMKLLSCTEEYAEKILSEIQIDLSEATEKEFNKAVIEVNEHLKGGM